MGLNERQPNKKRAVFLDRDGVINRALVRRGRPHPPSGLKELEILPGVPEALRRLKERGFLLICVTNQPDVARGAQKLETVQAMHEHLLHLLPLDEIQACYDDKRENPQRKPNPGMLEDAAIRFNIDLTRSFMVGDRWRDVDAGRNAGCTTLFIDRGYAESLNTSPDATVKDLVEAVKWVLDREALTPAEQIPGNLKVKIFADGADKEGVLELYRNPLIRGFTTNPTLMRRAGITDYEAFARDLAAAVPDRPLSFEVFSDDAEEMEHQAHHIARWGDNVYVKIPVTNTKGVSSAPLIRKLAREGVQLNITALTTLGQVREVASALEGGPSSFISVFAGRIADTGRDPVPLMAAAVKIMRPFPHLELIWASPRELLNVFQADAVGCHIITVTHDVLKKLPLVGRDLQEYSLATVKMFYDDARRVGYRLGVSESR